MSFNKSLVLFCGVTSAAILALGQDKFSERHVPYRLQPSDTIEVRYRYTPEFNGTVAIQPDGFANLPLVGDVELQGLTIHAAEDAVKKAASVRLNQPEVTILLRDYVKPYFVVSGEVARPGRFEMRGDVTAFEAIAISGGFKDSSKHSQVLLVRKYDREFAEVTMLDMKAMAKKDKIREDPLIRPGDMLIVPQNTVSKLERYVRWSNVGVWGLSLALP